MTIPLIDSLDEALGRLHPAKVTNELFSVETLRGETGREGKGRGGCWRRRGEQVEGDQVVARS